MKVKELLGAKPGYLQPQPEEVDKFWCGNSKLISLKGAPKKVSGNFVCSFNNLTSLEGGPTEVGGSYLCLNNQLTTLKGCARQIGTNPNNDSWSMFNCSNNQLTSFEHGPEYVDGNIDASDNQFTNLHDIHKHLKKLGGHCTLILTGNPIKSHVLGLLLIKGLNEVWLDNKVLMKILNRHLELESGKPRDLLACQEELLNSDLDEFAQL